MAGEAQNETNQATVFLAALVMAVLLVLFLPGPSWIGWTLAVLMVFGNMVSDDAKPAEQSGAGDGAQHADTTSKKQGQGFREHSERWTREDAERKSAKRDRGNNSGQAHGPKGEKKSTDQGSANQRERAKSAKQEQSSRARGSKSQKQGDRKHGSGGMPHGAAALLGLGRQFTELQLRDAYARALHRWHPDKHHKASERARNKAHNHTLEIILAYQSLRGNTAKQGRQHR